jgi:hypothetical protein
MENTIYSMEHFFNGMAFFFERNGRNFVLIFVRRRKKPSTEQRKTQKEKKHKKNEWNG